MALDLLPILPHSISHTLQHIRMLTRMHRRHRHPLNKRKRLNSQRLIQILLLYILLNQLIINRLPINILRTEEHPRRKVVLVIDDIHVVESNI